MTRPGYSGDTPADGMPAPARIPSSFVRPATGPVRTPGVSADESRRALVRLIAADPVHVAWLREHVAAHLDRVADRLAESTLQDVDACEAVRSIAGAHRRGETPLW